MTQQDAQRIGAHCHAQVESDQFSPRVQAAFDVIRGIPEYQRMAATLIHAHGINFRNDSGIIGASQISALVLCAIAYGFAFGEDWAEVKAIEASVADGGDGR